MEYTSSNPFGYRQSGNWRHYRDSRGWRYQPPYVPKPQPVQQLSVRHPSGGSGPDIRTRPKGQKYFDYDTKTGQMKPQKVYTGKSLPGYNPPKITYGDPKYKTPALRPSDAAWRALGFLGKVVPRLNPYVRAIDIAFQVAYAFQEDAEWSYQRNETLEDVLTAEGWHLCCKMTDRVDYWRPGGRWNNTNEPYEACIQVPLGCGLKLQVPQGKVSEGISWTIAASTYGERAYHNKLYLGPENPIRGRMDFEQIWGRTIIRPARDPARTITIPAPRKVAMPVPVTTPVPASITETYTPPSGRRKPRPGKPYQVPAVTVEVGSGNSGHIPPRTGVHNQLPPGPLEREKKGGVGLRQALGMLSRFYDGVTEANDLVDAIADAIPACRAVKGGMVSRLNCIYDNLDDLDIAQAVANIAINEAEDKAIGKFHKALKDAKAPFGSSMWQGYVR